MIFGTGKYRKVRQKSLSFFSADGVRTVMVIFSIDKKLLTDTPFDTLTFQHLPTDLQWANCTEYVLEVSGSSNFTQNADCSEVMADLKRPLFYGQSYVVNLSIVSNICTSPSTSLTIQTTKKDLRKY